MIYLRERANLYRDRILKDHFKIKDRTFSNVLSYPKVGMTGFEPATSRPPDVHSNRAELHPDLYLHFCN